MSMETQLNTKQAATVAGVHPRTIVAWIRRNWLPAKKLPGPRGQYRIDPGELDDLINRRYQPQDQE